MVLQDTWLKQGTIRDNITVGKPEATEEEIIAAAKASHAHSFIRRLPKGYDTVIGEDGGSLSQGQKQLLCITRVMLSLPPMLILDEATSSNRDQDPKSLCRHDGGQNKFYRSAQAVNDPKCGCDPCDEGRAYY